jgi:hypothetical protein
MAKESEFVLTDAEILILAQNYFRLSKEAHEDISCECDESAVEIMRELRGIIRKMARRVVKVTTEGIAEDAAERALDVHAQKQANQIIQALNRR